MFITIITIITGHLDDILLLSDSAAGLQEMFNVYDQSDVSHSRRSLKFNCAKLFCIAFGQNCGSTICEMKLGDDRGVINKYMRYFGLLSVAVDYSHIYN